ncbi:MAG: 1-deoxy-D-xylulose-5-phosphate synthase [Phycisphaerae bacterium]
MALLEHIQSPADVQALKIDQLPALAQEIRDRIIDVVGRKGGHFASNLGVADLTIALHYCFDFSKDRLLWDVGHQCYPHKLLTGRAGQFETIRQAGGISGFPSIHESEYDLFNVGHAGTSIATAIGMARGDTMMGRDTHVVAVVGDASIVNGVAFEGLNQAGTLDRQLLIVLNDNRWGIAPSQGAIAEWLAKFRAGTVYGEIKQRAKTVLPKVPLVGSALFEALDHLKEGIKATVTPLQIFEQLGLKYMGPVDGHDIPHLINLLKLLKDVPHPVVLHVHTVKGRGADWATKDPGRFHSPKPFVVQNGKVTIKSGSGKSWTRAFVDALIALAKDNKKIYAMTAGMPDGTGLDRFAKAFPDRWRDIGIAESCTVDIAAGLAKCGLRPVCAIYSTFLQRAFDQVFQEVVLQGHPVMFCMDRAGLVGGDGAVHHGFLDITYLRGLPNMVLMAPMDEPELNEAMRFGLTLKCASAIRYPRDVVPTPVPHCPPFELGVSRRLRSGEAATILAYGVTAVTAMSAAELLAAEGHQVAVVNARFAKPVDGGMVRRAFAHGRPVLTVEDHSIAGGFGSAVLETASRMGVPIESFRRLGLPDDRFIEHGSRAGQLAEAGIDVTGIATAVRQLIEERCGPPAPVAKAASSARPTVGRALPAFAQAAGHARPTG